MVLKAWILPFAFAALSSQVPAQETLARKPRLVLEAEISGAWAQVQDDSLARSGAAGSLRLSLRSTPQLSPMLIVAVANANAAAEPASITEGFLLGGVRLAPRNGRVAPFLDVAVGAAASSFGTHATVESWPIGILLGLGARFGNDRTALVLGYETVGPIAGGYNFQTWRAGLRRRLISR